jgi:hypothetical protein
MCLYKLYLPNGTLIITCEVGIAAVVIVNESFKCRGETSRRDVKIPSRVACILSGHHLRRLRSLKLPDWEGAVAAALARSTATRAYLSITKRYRHDRRTYLQAGS